MDNERKEHEVGETFEFNNITYEVRECPSCKGCAFFRDWLIKRCLAPCDLENCVAGRHDHKSVIFVEISNV